MVQNVQTNLSGCSYKTITTQLVRKRKAEVCEVLTQYKERNTMKENAKKDEGGEQGHQSLTQQVHTYIQ